MGEQTPYGETAAKKMKAAAERIYCASILENDFCSDCKRNENELFMVVHHAHCFASALFLSSESIERRYSLFSQGDENSFIDLVAGNASGIVLGLTKSGSIFTMDWLNRKLEKTQSTTEALPVLQSVINVLDLGLFGTCSPTCFARHSFESRQTDCSVAPARLWREFGALALKRYFVVGCSNGHVILLKLTRGGRIQESSIGKELKGLPNRLASASSDGRSASSSPRTPTDSLASSSKADSRRSLSPMNTSRKRSSYGGARRRSREFKIDVPDFPEPSSRRQKSWFDVSRVGDERKPSEEAAVDSLIYEFHRENLVFKVLPQRFSVVRICELPMDAGAGGFLLETESSELFYWHRAADISSISRDSTVDRNRSTDTRIESDRFMSNRSDLGGAVGSNEAVEVEGMAREEEEEEEEVEDIWRDALSDEEAESPADSSRGNKTHVIGSWRSDGVTPREAVDAERDPDDWTEKKCSYGEVVYLQSTSWSHGCPSMSSGVVLTKHWYSFLKCHSVAVSSSADATDDHAVALVGVLRRPIGVLECYEIPSPDTAAMKRNDSDILEHASVRPRLSLDIQEMLSNRGKVTDLLLLPVLDDESGFPLHLMAIALELPLADSHGDESTAMEDNVWADSMTSHTNVIVLFDMGKTLVRQVFRCNSGEKLTDRMALLPSTANTLEPSILVTTNRGVVVIACKASSHRKSPAEEPFPSKKCEIEAVPQAGERGTVDALMVSQLRCAIQELCKSGSSQNKQGLEPLDKLLAAIPSSLVTRSIFRELLIHGLVDRAVCLLREHSAIYEFLCAWNEVSASMEGRLQSPLNEEMCYQLLELYLPPEENLFFDSTHRQRWMDMQSSLLQLLTSIMSTEGQLMCILSSRGPLQKALLPRLYALLANLTQEEIQFAIATFITIIIRSEVVPRGSSSPASLSPRKSGIPKLTPPLTAQKASTRSESDVNANEPRKTRRLRLYSSACDAFFKMRDNADHPRKRYYCKECEMQLEQDTKILLALSLQLLLRSMKIASWEKESGCSDPRQWSSLLELVSEKEPELSKDWSAKEIKGFVDGLVQTICSRAFAKCSEPSTSLMDCLVLLVDFSQRSGDCWLALNWCNQLLRAVGEPPVVQAMLSLALLNCSSDATRFGKNLQDHLTVVDTLTNTLTLLRSESITSGEKMRSLETQMETLPAALGMIILSSVKQGIGQEFIDAVATRILSEKNEILTLGLRSLLVGLKHGSSSLLRVNDEFRHILELKWSGKLLLLLHKVTPAAEFDIV